MNFEQCIRSAIDRTVGPVVPEYCPPVLAEKPGPETTVWWVNPNNKLTPAAHVAEVAVMCNDVHPDHPACSRCQLASGVLVQLQQNPN